MDKFKEQGYYQSKFQILYQIPSIKFFNDTTSFAEKHASEHWLLVRDPKTKFLMEITETKITSH